MSYFHLLTKKNLAELGTPISKNCSWYEVSPITDDHMHKQLATNKSVDDFSVSNISLKRELDSLLETSILSKSRSTGSLILNKSMPSSRSSLIEALNLDNSRSSWSSSLATTPPRSHKMTGLLSTSKCEHYKHVSPGVARMLFSPGMRGSQESMAELAECLDFKSNSMVLNSTPIHTPKTRIDSPKVNSILESDVLDDVMFIFNTPPKQTSTRCKKTVPKRPKRHLSQLSQDDLFSIVDDLPHMPKKAKMCDNSRTMEDTITNETYCMTDPNFIDDHPTSPELGTQRVLNISDLSFTQMSPAGLSALCAAVETTEQLHSASIQKDIGSIDAKLVENDDSVCVSPILSQSRLSFYRNDGSQRGMSSQQLSMLSSQASFCYPQVQVTKKICNPKKLFLPVTSAVKQVQQTKSQCDVNGTGKTDIILPRREPPLVTLKSVTSSPHTRTHIISPASECRSVGELTPAISGSGETNHGIDNVPTSSVNTGKFNVGFSTASKKTLTVHGDSMKQAAKMLSETKIGSSIPNAASVVCEPKTVAVNSLHPGYRPFKAPRIREHKVNVPRNTETELSTVSATQREVMESVAVFLDNDNGYTQDFELSSQNSTKSVGQNNISVTHDLNDNVDITHTTIPFMNGFHTACGHSIAVSNEAMGKARSLLDGVDKAEFDHENISINNDRKDLVPDTDSNVGFKTAGGACINISEQAMLKSKSLYEQMDCEMEHNLKCPDKSEISSTTEFGGFQTAKGQTIKLSKHALLKAKLLIDQTENDSNQVENTEVKGLKSTEFIGFQSTNGKDITLSEKSKADTKLLINSCGDEVMRADMENKTGPSEFIGFKTASGHGIKISHQAISKAKVLIDNCDNDTEAKSTKEYPKTDLCTVIVNKDINVGETDNVGGVSNDIECPSSPEFCGFKTAGGKKMSMSVSSLAKVKQLFASHMASTDDDYNGIPTEQTRDSYSFGKGNSSRCFSVETSNRSLAGLESETNKPVDEHDIKCGDGSPNQLDQINGLEAASCHNGEEIDVGKFDMHPDDKVCESGPFVGFQTAKGDKVTVSKEMLAKVKDLFDNNEDDANYTGYLDQDQHLQKVTDPAAFTGFQTARGTKVDVSKTALLKAQRLLDEETSYQFKDDAQESLGNCGAIEFQSSNGNAVTASKKSLESPSVNKSVGFQTAGGKSIAVSKAALQKVKEFFMDDTTDKAIGNLTADAQSCGGFQTANGKKVVVSDESLNRVRELFDESLVVHRQPIAQHDVDDTRTCASSPEYVSRNTILLNSEETRELVGDTEEWDSFNLSSEDILATATKETSSCVPATIKDNDTIRTSSATKESSELQATGTSVQQINPSVMNARKDELQKQLQIINKKKNRQHKNVTVSHGKLYNIKSHSNNRLSMRKAVNYTSPQSYTRQQLLDFGIHQKTLEVSSTTAENFQFLLSDYYSSNINVHSVSVRTDDDAEIIINENGYLDKESFANTLYALPNVDPSLLCREWVYNHYRWIVYKLAALEVAFPEQFAARCLTPNNVMLQLKYRYDREIDLSHRSAVKKIHENDDSPARTMVLLVANITQITDNTTGTTTDTTDKVDGKDDTQLTKYELELSDGWYSISARVDKPMESLIQRRRIVIGQKLCISGSEFITQHEPTPPLQPLSTTRLRLCYNSARPAQWYSKLGFCNPPHPICVPLCSLHSQGGIAACVDVVISRVYPIQFMEKLPGGGHSFRCLRAEEKAAQLHDKQQSLLIDKLYTEIQQQYETKQHCKVKCGRSKKSSWTPSEIRNLHTGEGIYEACMQCVDPNIIQSCLTTHQLSLLEEFQQKQNEELHYQMQTELKAKLVEAQSKRVVTPMLRLCVIGCSTKDLDSSTACMLTVWRPNSDIVEQLVEGKRFKIYNLMVGEPRNHNISTTISLSAVKSTRYNAVDVNDNFLDIMYEERQVTDVGELCEGFTPRHGEVDMVGIVIAVKNRDTFNLSSHRYDVVYIADRNGDICAIKFWDGLHSHGTSELIQPEVLLSFTNLQWQCNSRDIRPTLTAGDRVTVSTNPKPAYLVRRIARFKQSVGNISEFCSAARTQLGSAISVEPVVSVSTPDAYKYNMNESPHNTSASYSNSGPPSMNKKRLLQKNKLAKLCQYGTPPVLRELQSPIVRTVRKAFTAPRLVGNKRTHDDSNDENYLKPMRLMEKMTDT